MIDCAVIVNEDIHGILTKNLMMYGTIGLSFLVLLRTFVVVLNPTGSSLRPICTIATQLVSRRPSFAPFLPIGVTSITLSLIFELEVAILRTCSCITSCTTTHARKSAHWS